MEQYLTQGQGTEKKKMVPLAEALIRSLFAAELAPQTSDPEQKPKGLIGLARANQLRAEKSQPLPTSPGAD
jgi:hypothetical protein